MPQVRDQFVLLFNGEKTPEELAEDLRIQLEVKKAKDAEEAKESAKLRKKEADLAKRRLEEAAKLAEMQKGNSRLKPMIMTYNEETKRAEPVDLEKYMKEQQAIQDAAKEAEEYIKEDDDMPSEEELAVYDTDYLSADDENDSEDENSDNEAEKRNE